MFSLRPADGRPDAVFRGIDATGVLPAPHFFRLPLVDLAGAALLALDGVTVGVTGVVVLVVAWGVTVGVTTTGVGTTTGGGMTTTTGGITTGVGTTTATGTITGSGGA